MFNALADLRSLCACPSSKHSMCYNSRALTQRDLDSKMPGSIPIIWDRKGNHKDGRNVLFLDGSLLFMDEASFLNMQLKLLNGSKLLSD
ncbi:hypothetical protein ACFL54_08410 [Planctomycetota bacterium]